MYKRQELIKTDLKSKDKWSIIEELAQLFVDAGYVEDKNEFVNALRRREEIESTAIGDGIAIPHARSEAVKELHVAFGRAKDGVNFDALDKKPVHLIFMIAAPQNVRKEYLQAVAKVARLLKSQVMKKALLNANTVDEVMRIIMDFDGVAPEQVKIKTKEGRVVYGG